MKRTTLIAVALVPAAAAAAPARTPQINKLAKAALSCKFEDGAFDDECAAYKAWTDNEPLFADGKGNDTLLSMLEDPDVKVRTLAADKAFDEPARYFADKGHATRLFAIAAKESSSLVARRVGYDVTWVDADKLALGNELRALAKHPVEEMRTAISSTIARTQSPSAVALIQTLVDDRSTEVQKSAISALSTGGITPGVEPVCTLLARQLHRSDALASDALWAGSSSKCAGMDKLVITELGKRVADPSKVTNAVGIGYALAASGVCTHSDSAELKKAAFSIGKKLADRNVPDANTRHAALDVLVECNRAEASPLLASLAKDKDQFVAKAATDKLAELRKK